MHVVEIFAAFGKFSIVFRTDFDERFSDVYEIELNVNVAAMRKDKNLYIIDLKYVGLFEIKGLTDDIKEAYLLVECPRQLFPFARRIIYDLHGFRHLHALGTHRPFGAHKASGTHTASETSTAPGICTAPRTYTASGA